MDMDSKIAAEMSVRGPVLLVRISIRDISRISITDLCHRSLFGICFGVVWIVLVGGIAGIAGTVRNGWDG
jgi:hypothetical protein